jgi:hypothetical protein
MATVGWRNATEKRARDAQKSAGRSLAFPDQTESLRCSRAFEGGACRDRTGDLRLAKPALSQLS